MEKFELQENGWKTREEELNDMASAIEELSLRMERMEKGWKLEKSHLESRLENKNQQVELEA